jgi:hypothetical protein
MTDLAPGIYEQLVTHELQSHLRLLDARLVDRVQLDAADAHEILDGAADLVRRRHIRDLVSRDPWASWLSTHWSACSFREVRASLIGSPSQSEGHLA